jgi:hypothetical protein
LWYAAHVFKKYGKNLLFRDALTVAILQSSEYKLTQNVGLALVALELERLICI